MDNFKELVRSNRTFRRYDASKALTKDLLVDLVEVSRFTPSGVNKQALRFAVSFEKDMNDKIFENVKWAGYLKEWPGPVEEERPTGYIVFLEDARYGSAMAEDVGIDSQTIGLYARSKGLGVCIFKSYNGEEIRKILGLDDNYKVVLVMSVGYPVEEVVIDDIREGEDIKYYRDSNQVHHVPKIVLDDILVK